MISIKRAELKIKESYTKFNVYRRFYINDLKINKTKGIYYIKAEPTYIDAFYECLIKSSKFCIKNLFKSKYKNGTNVLLIDGKKSNIHDYLFEDTKSNRQFFARLSVEARLNYGENKFNHTKKLLDSIDVKLGNRIKELTNYQFLRLEILNANLKKPKVFLVNPCVLDYLSAEETKDINARLKELAKDILVFYPYKGEVDDSCNQIILDKNLFLVKQDDAVETYEHDKRDSGYSVDTNELFSRRKKKINKKFILNFSKFALTCSALVFILSTTVLNLMVNNNFDLGNANYRERDGDLDYFSDLVEIRNQNLNSKIAEIMASDEQIVLPAKIESNITKPRYSFDFNTFDYLTLPAAEMNTEFRNNWFFDIFNPQDAVHYDEDTSSYFYLDRNVNKDDIDKIVEELNIYPAAIVRNLPNAKFNTETGNPDPFVFLDNFDLSNYLIGGIKYEESIIKEALAAYYPISSNYFVFINGTSNETSHFPSYLTMISGTVPNDSYGIVITDYKLELYKKFGFQYYENGELKSISGNQVTAENILNKQIYLNDINTNSTGFSGSSFWDKKFWYDYMNGDADFPDGNQDDFLRGSNTVELSKVYISGVAEFKSENNDVANFLDYAEDQLKGILTIDTNNSSEVSLDNISSIDLYNLVRKKLSQNNEIWGEYFDSIYTNFALNAIASPASAIYVNANSTFNKLYSGTGLSSQKNMYDFFKLGDTYDNLCSFFLCDRYKEESEYLCFLNMCRFSHAYKVNDLLKDYILSFYPVDIFEDCIFNEFYTENRSPKYSIDKSIIAGIEENTLLFNPKMDVLYSVTSEKFITENKDCPRIFETKSYYKDLDISNLETCSVQYSFNNKSNLSWLKSALIVLNCLIVISMLIVYKPYKESYQTVLASNNYGVFKQIISVVAIMLIPILLAFGTSLLISFAQLGDYSFVLETLRPDYSEWIATNANLTTEKVNIFVCTWSVFTSILADFGYSLIYILAIPIAVYIGIWIIERYFGKYIIMAYRKIKEVISTFFKLLVNRYLKD